VSGGVDSMVMLQLFSQTGYNIGVAHCNFQLRGAESNGDEAFVNAACRERQIPFHGQRFDTKIFAEKSGISVQMAARELRYLFFEELMNNLGYQYLATGHHLNDSLETVLLNLTRGTGIDGMYGMPLRKNRTIRPMLFAAKQMINDYAIANHIEWREDRSNSSEDYQRNFIRLQVIPRLKDINPNLEETFLKTSERIYGASRFSKIFIDDFMKNAVVQSQQRITIDMLQLNNTPAPDVLLWEMIKSRGFNFDQCTEIVLTHQPGKIFYSDKYQLTVDRVLYIIEPLKESAELNFMITEPEKRIENEFGILLMDTFSIDKLNMDPDRNIAQLDNDLIKYPLIWRTWKPGDLFIPLGMNHSKKISDFLIDIKMPVTEKDSVSVIESGGVIVWIVGLRIHDHLKVTDRTRQVLRMTIKNKALKKVSQNERLL
jgi:tRNA(Ile)-lysidine synthase